MADDITIAGKTIALDEVTIESATKLVARDKIGWGSPGTYNDVDLAHPVPVQEGGTYAYRAGTATGTVDVPTGAQLKRVSVSAGITASATVTIGGGDTITIPAGDAFDEQIPGQAVSADVVIGGSIQSYYVSWVA
jgi:hypothetical protein